MVLVLVIVLAVVLPAGVLLAWMVSGSRNRDSEARVRAQQLDAELLQAKAALEGAQTDLRVQIEREATLREQIARLANANENAAAQIQQGKLALDEALAVNARLREQGEISGRQAAELRATLDSGRASFQDKLALLTAARDAFSNHFEVLANRVLEEKSKTFTEQNQANLGNLITPLKEKFGEFQTKVESLERDGVAGRSELKAQIEQLRSLNERLSQDATNLVSALKGSSKTQGDWGEFVLESILESSGLRKGHEYRVQESFLRVQDDGSDDGRSRARLDVILDLPEGRHIVLDSKVSLNDYTSYCDAGDEGLREAALGRHLASVRGHIRDLSKRNYQSLYGLNSLDFVVMFVPIEPAFMLAIARDGKLWHEAWERNVLLVSPSTLLFVLRTVAQLWRQEQQTRNVQEIVRRGGRLYDELAAFAKDLTDVGKSLNAARNSYDEAYKKLAQKNGNVIRQAEILKGLGVKPTKSMPLPLLEALADVGDAEELLELAAAAEETAEAGGE